MTRHRRWNLESRGKSLPVSSIHGYPISFLDPRTGAFSHGISVLRELTLSGMEVQHIPFARALIAHTIRPTPTLEDLTILGYPGENPDTAAWHLIDTILFALHRKSQIRIDAVTNLNMGTLLPLMSLVRR